MISPDRVYDTLIRVAQSANDEQEFIDALVGEGLSPAEALKAFRFTQVRWARSILQKLPITFSDDFVFFDELGAVRERGKLEGEKWFVAAGNCTSKYQSTKEFQQIASASSEFQAVNSALNAGSRSKDLVLTSVFMFPPDISEDGIRSAQKIIQDEANSRPLRTSPEPRNGENAIKPWWKIW